MQILDRYFYFSQSVVTVVMLHISTTCLNRFRDTSKGANKKVWQGAYEERCKLDKKFGKKHSDNLSRYRGCDVSIPYANCFVRMYLT